MSKVEYDDGAPVTMASEPAVAYVSSAAEAVPIQNRSKDMPPPCQHTVEEAIQRVIKATADVDAGRDLMSHEEFEKIVRSWYN